DMGYELSEDQLNEAFAKFKDIADKKKHVTDEDVRAMIEEKLIDTPETFVLDKLQVTYSNQSTPSAVVSLRTIDGDVIELTAQGNGSVDAIYQAIDQATGEVVELEDYAIQSVSQGTDAIGEVHVLLKQNGVSVQGRGISTDILE